MWRGEQRAEFAPLSYAGTDADLPQEKDSFLGSVPRWICLGAWIFGILAVICVGTAAHILFGRSVVAPGLSVGFCCWRDHPIPFYGGDPCSCPEEHRGDYACPEEGCTDSTGFHWQRGSGKKSNDPIMCHEAVTGAWCPGLSAARPATPPAKPSGPLHPSSKGFCCWRDHPLPAYSGDACLCPVANRGDYECPPEGCTDASGQKWQRGSAAPRTNQEAYCKSLPSLASWCAGRRLNATVLNLRAGA